jgi:hypothetical protein
MLAQREVAVFVYDAVHLEGINFTFPDILDINTIIFTAL